MLLAVTAFGASASSYNDFTQGIAAHNRDDSQTAIDAFSRALAAHDLVPSQQSVALLDRGMAYARLKRYREAISDFDAVLKDTPDNYDAHNYRSTVYDWMDEFPAALPDCQYMTSVKPHSAQLLASCGRIAYMSARYDVAAGYFEKSIALRRTDSSKSYDWLWLSLTELRAGQPLDESLTATGRRIYQRTWPRPIIGFFSGQRDTKRRAGKRGFER